MLPNTHSFSCLNPRFWMQEAIVPFIPVYRRIHVSTMAFVPRLSCRCSSVHVYHLSLDPYVNATALQLLLLISKCYLLIPRQLSFPQAQMSGSCCLFMFKMHRVLSK